MADPKKIIFWIVSHWKLLLILILAGGLAACGLRFAKGKSAVKQKTESNTDGKANYESLTQADRADVDYAAANYVVLKHAQEAMTKDSETPWVWADPYHAQTMTISLRIVPSQPIADAGKEQVLCRGAAEYFNAYVSSGRLGEDLASADGTDAQNDGYYISEVSSVSAVSSVSNTTAIVENSSSDVLTVSLLLSGLEELKPESAVKVLQDYAQKYSSADGGFTLEEIDAYTTTEYRSDLAQLQNNVTNVYFNDKTRHDTNKTKLSDAQISAYNYLIEEKLGSDFSEADCLRLNGDGTVTTAGTGSSSLRGYKFYGLVGVLAGLLIFLLILLYSMMNGRKFRGEEDIVKLPGLAYLGIMWNGKDRFSTAKKRLYRWVYPKEYERTPAETAEASALQAGSICRKLGIEKLCAISSGSSILASENTDVLKKALKEQGIEMEALPNAAYGIEERRKLAGAQGVLLIEASEHSLLKEMRNELHLCDSLNVPAVGVVDYKG